MDASTTTFRDEIRETVSPHKFGGSRRAAALWLLAQDGGQDDQTGDACDWHYWTARFGRHLLTVDSQGFVYSQRCKTVADAEAIFAENAAYYGASEATVQTLAAEAASWFENATRDDDSSFVKTRDDRPDWLTSLIYDAHGDMFPDDWKYGTIRDALEFIADCDDPDDGYGEFADMAVDVYDADRIAWLASHGDRQGYCDDAAEEFCLCDAGVIHRIGIGQYYEANEVYGSVLSSLEDRLAELRS